MKNRAKDYYRYQRNKHINRKKKIIRYNGWYVSHDGKLSKGKIHCSCWMCRFEGITMSDLRKQLSMDQKEREFYKSY